MDPIELFILALVGGAAWLYFGNAAPASATSAQTSPTPTTTPLTSQPSTGTALTPGTTISAAGTTTGGGTTITKSTTGLPSDSAIAQANAALLPSMSASAKSKWASACAQMLGNLQISAADTDNCSGFSSTNTTFKAITGVGAGAAAAGASVAAGAGIIASAAVPVIGIAIAGVTALITQIFQHHAQKVQQQAQLDCAGCAAANNAWSEIVNAIASGQFNASQAQQAFEAVNTQFAALVAPMNNSAPGDCNGPCGLTVICRAICTKFELIYGLTPGGPY